MQAIVQDRYGEALDVLRLEEVGQPTIGDAEVLLRVYAAGVDRGVWHLMAGLPYPVRLAGYGVRAPTNRTRGARWQDVWRQLVNRSRRFRWATKYSRHARDHGG